MNYLNSLAVVSASAFTMADTSPGVLALADVILSLTRTLAFSSCYPALPGTTLACLHTWPYPGLAEGLAALGHASDATWPALATAAYTRFEIHWAAGVTYRL